MKVTIREILNSGHWEKLCELRGWDYYRASPSEGRDEFEEINLTDEEIKALLGIEP